MNREPSNPYAELKQIWTTLFPAIPAPDDWQWGIWQLRHDPRVIREALAETGLKFAKLRGQMTPLWVGKFASSVMNRLTEQQQSTTKVV